MSETNTVVLNGEKQEHGVQAVLGRRGAAYARGGVHGTQAENIRGKRALEVSGEEPDGHSLDGSTVTGKRQPDDVLANVTDTPTGQPANVKVAEGNLNYNARGLGGTTHTPAPDPKNPTANAAPGAIPATAKAPAPAPAPAPAAKAEAENKG